MGAVATGPPVTVTSSTGGLTVISLVVVVEAEVLPWPVTPLLGSTMGVVATGPPVMMVFVVAGGLMIRIEGTGST